MCGFLHSDFAVGDEGIRVKGRNPPSEAYPEKMIKRVIVLKYFLKSGVSGDASVCFRVVDYKCVMAPQLLIRVIVYLLQPHEVFCAQGF